MTLSGFSLQSGEYKADEEGVRRGWTRLELGVELAGYEVWVLRQLNYFYELAVARDPADAPPRLLQRFSRLRAVVQLVAVAVSLGDNTNSVSFSERIYRIDKICVTL